MYVRGYSSGAAKRKLQKQSKENDINHRTLEDFGWKETPSIIAPEQNTSDNRTEL